jgi:cytochrome c peroxidase
MKFFKTAILACLIAANSAFAWESLPSEAPAPKDNPTTAAKAELGKMLFFDPRFSITGTVSCFSCHNVNVWRVPTLRNLTYTAPYFHNGAVKHMDEAVRIMAKAELNKELSDAEVADVVAFLESLTGEFSQQTMPRLPPTPGDLLE